MPRAPKRREIIKELTLFKDLISLMHPRTRQGTRSAQLTGKHIILFPGYGVDGRYFKPLARFLENHGHHTYDWGLGVNDAGTKRNFKMCDLSDTWEFSDNNKAKSIHLKELGVPYLCSKAVERTQELAQSLGTQVVVLGWSLGGYIAREVARDLPQNVSQVITFGTPTLGGPKYTASAKSFIEQGIDINWIEREILKRDKMKINQPITLIYGRYDGVVHKSACLDAINPKVSTHRIETGHMGMGFHYPMWQIVLEALAQDYTLSS
jgi:pimeloyl-ACP methyl ester carboxylesterase